jgi:hypothetical protein
MSFFNKKEDVIEIELTQYGKHLLSTGRFKPHYYSFFDDDILYDSRFGGFSENQNDAEGRIQEETPIQRVQYLYSGAETEVGRNVYEIKGPTYAHGNANSAGAKRVMPLVPSSERNYAFYAPLGKSDYSSDKAPAWNVKLWEGEFTGSVLPWISGSHPGMQIPQLSASIEYRISFAPEFEQKLKNIIELQKSDAGAASDAFADLQSLVKNGTLPMAAVVNVKEEMLLMEILEENTVYSNKNFDIEVFIKQTRNPGSKGKVGKNASQVEKLIPLVFEKRYSEIKNNILLDPDEVPNRFGEMRPQVKPNHAEYYFDISIDREIPPVQMRKSVPNRKSKGYFTDSTIFRGRDVSSILQTDIGEE